jgi:hypothetical protein
MFLKKRDEIVTPLSASRSEENAATELTKATTTNARIGKNVLGIGRLSKRGIVSKITNNDSGYIARGRTNVLPPTPEGK